MQVIRNKPRFPHRAPGKRTLPAQYRSWLLRATFFASIGAIASRIVLKIYGAENASGTVVHPVANALSAIAPLHPGETRNNPEQTSDAGFFSGIQGTTDKYLLRRIEMFEDCRVRFRY